MKPVTILTLTAPQLAPPAALRVADAPQPAAKPNVLFLVADDMGYAACGVQGCRDVPTPNLDAIALGGIRFTNGYRTPILGLYDLNQDIGESGDLSSTRPERGTQLPAAWASWGNSIGGDQPLPQAKQSKKGR